MRRTLSAVLTAAATVAAGGIVALTVPAANPQPAWAWENGLARTPPMGFNNWNFTHCDAIFNETTIKRVADAFVSLGLRDVGYQYLNIDDCWAETARDASGNLVPNRTRFPSGIKSLADYVHARGLKFGIYTSAGTKTCNSLGFPGGLGHEQQDANLFASWGVDYLKYDNCNNQGVDAQQRYGAMHDALAATGRPVVYSITEWGSTTPKVWTWGAPVGNLWRTTGDISDNWSSMIGKLHTNDDLAKYAGPGHWNDPDMLEVGNGGMTATEYRTHFSLWAMMSAPLLMGSNVPTLSQANLDILKNTDVIALDQDPLGQQAVIVSSSNGLVVYRKPLSNGDMAVALLNETAATTTVSTTASAIGMPGGSSYTLKDLWSKASRTTSGAISASVPSHGTVVYRVTRTGATAPAAGTRQLSDLTWTSVTNGWGPVEKDRSVNTQTAGDGRTLTVGGTTFSKGLGAHAQSSITYFLGGRCSSVAADVGVDDETGTNGRVVFQIWRDGTKVADSGIVTGSQGAKHLTADVSGGTTLLLAAIDGGDGINSDHADWSNAQVTCT
ncbi:MAG TPA: NPCBM/NEW2 domain-containing protein [Actinophytocola sp.]|jgi:alpha-galactosidase|uniref:NPCBM/NEW2 domain-containing protein n=1 Tax=Actinophytocola sp. TaxID=1872138 RepID=UPI002DF9C655|nr:NPCBM/NEW2 domain-containing protein [Actinophytocola sp.]